MNICSAPMIVEADGTPFKLVARHRACCSSWRAWPWSSEVVGRGFACEAKLRWPAMREAIEHLHFRDLCQAIETINPVRRNWDGYVELRSYRQGVARLRIALLRNDERSQVASLLAACMACYEAQQLHPLIEICGRPFEPAMLSYYRAAVAGRNPGRAAGQRAARTRHGASHPRLRARAFRGADGGRRPDLPCAAAGPGRRRHPVRRAGRRRPLTWPARKARRPCLSTAPSPCCAANMPRRWPASKRH